MSLTWIEPLHHDWRKTSAQFLNDRERLDLLLKQNTKAGSESSLGYRSKSGARTCWYYPSEQQEFSLFRTSIDTRLQSRGPVLLLITVDRRVGPWQAFEYWIPNNTWWSWDLRPTQLLRTCKWETPHWPYTGHYLTYTSVKACHDDGIMGIWELSYGLSWLDVTIKLVGVSTCPVQ